MNIQLTLWDKNDFFFLGRWPSPSSTSHPSRRLALAPPYWNPKYATAIGWRCVECYSIVINGSIGDYAAAAAADDDEYIS